MKTKMKEAPKFYNQNYLPQTSPGLTKDAFHTFFINEKNVYHTLSYSFIELRYMYENSRMNVFSKKKLFDKRFIHTMKLYDRHFFYQ